MKLKDKITASNNNGVISNTNVDHDFYDNLESSTVLCCVKHLPSCSSNSGKAVCSKAELHNAVGMTTHCVGCILIDATYTVNEYRNLGTILKIFFLKLFYPNAINFITSS